MISLETSWAMGDSIICNGIVRHYAEQQEVVLFCKDYMSNHIQYMYRDDPNIQIQPIKTHDWEALLHPKADIEVHYLPVPLPDQSMYQRANVPFEYRWSKFKFQRDPEREVKLFQKLDIKPGQQYLLYCDTTSTHSYELKLPKIEPKIKVQPITDFIFDWIAVAQFAREIHTVDTAFFNLVQSFKYMPKIFLHDLKVGCPHPTLLSQTSLVKYKR